MIRGTLYENVFETQSCRSVSVDCESIAVGDFVAKVAGGDGNYAVYLNGGYCEDQSTLIGPDDFVSVLCVPDGIEWIVAGAIIGILALDALVIKPLTEDLEQQQADLQEQIREATDRDGSAVNTYYGFQNNYYPLGECVPVVYGQTQVAPICVQRSIISNLTPADSPFDFDIAINEMMNLLMVVSHGPIEGFGQYKGKVSNATEFSSLVTSVGANIPERLRLRINNIAGQHIDHSIRWRTGEIDQTPIRGASAGLFDPYDPGQSYILNQSLNNQTQSITDIDKPSGLYTYANRITNSNPLHYTSQVLSSTADKAAITVLFERGLFTGADDGEADPASVSFRVQYWETDEAGNPVGDVFILPELTIVENLTTPFSADFPIALQSATGASYDRLGYAVVDQSTSNLIRNYSLDTADPPPAYWVSVPTLSTVGQARQRGCAWSFACWASLKLGQLNGSDNFTLCSWGSEVVADHANALAFNMPNARTSSGGATGSGSQVFQQGNIRIRIQRDTTNAFGQGSDKIYLTMWSVSWAANGADFSQRSSAVFAKRSLDPIGSVNEAVDGYWPSPGATCHIGVTNGIQDSSQGSPMVQRAYINGVEVPLVNMPRGDFFRNRGGNQRGSGDYSRFGAGNAGVVSYYESPGVPSYLVEDAADRAKLFGAFNTIDTYSSSGYAGAPPQHDTMLAFGCHDNFSNALSFNSSAGHIAQAMWHNHDGNTDLRDPSWFALAAATSGNNNVHTFDIYNDLDRIQFSGQKGYLARFDEDERVGTTMPNRDTTTATDMTVSAGGFLDTGGPVYIISFEDSDPSYYQIEVFRSSADGTSSTDEQTEAQIRRITTARTQDFEYPGVAIAGISVAANDQLRTSTPRITFNVFGRKVPVVKGFSPSGAAIIEREWSNNPAYVALDVLSDREYGMGSVFSPNGSYENFDLRQFYEWGQFCDEGVPDAYGNLEFYKLATNDGLDGYLGLYFGVTTSSGDSVNIVPGEWSQGKFFSIASIVASGLSSDWVTALDSETGLNGASALMEIIRVQFDTGNEAISNGFSSIVKITCQWNRVASDGSFLFPDEGTFLAADYGLDSLGTAGQYEERCRFDGFFDSRNMSGWDAAMMVFKAGRAMPVKLGSRITPVWDRPRDPVGLVTQANMIADSLRINYSNPFTRPNSMEIEFNDRDLEYEKNRVVVDHSSIQTPDSIEEVRKERKYRRGVVRRSQIIRDAYYQLNKLHLQRRQYEFKLGPDALHLVPGDRLLLSHDVPDYGKSGRLAADFTSSNTFPSSTELVNSLSVNGGQCVISIRSIMDADDETPPIASYSTGVAHAYSVPTVNLGSGYVLAGESGGNGFESLPTWASQHVAVASGFYPTPDYSGGILSPLGRITYQDQKVEFSIFVKEPDAGASPLLRLGIFRICDDVGYVNEFEGVVFAWSSGNLSFDSFDAASGSSAMSYSIEYQSDGWYRVAVMYDNGLGAGSAGVGDYVQARCYFSYSSSNETFKPVAEGGRGNQFLKYGDPLDIVSQIGGASPWVQANSTTGSNSIRASAVIAPPLYPEDTTVDTVGDHGYVVQLTKDGSIATGTTPPVMRQRTVFLLGSAVSSWNGERVCMTGYARLNSITSPTSPTLVVNLRSGTSIDGNGIPDGDGVEFTLSAASAASSWTASTATFASSGTVANVAASVAPVRLNSVLDSPDWVQFNLSFDYTPSSGQFGTMQVSLHADEGGSVNSTIDVWGLRVHGAGGTSATPSSDALVNSNVHIGHLLWGAQFVEDSSWAGTGTATTFAPGGGLVLDRDITVEAGKSYEFQIRSSSQVDMSKNTEVIERLVMAEDQIPSSGSALLEAGTTILVQPPSSVSPMEGDVYAFGEVGQGIKDIVIESVSLDPRDLVREVRATDYSDGFYNDTGFAEIDSTSETYSTDRNSGTAGDMGYGSSSQAPYPFSANGRYATFRNRDGGIQPYVDLNWNTPELDSSFAEVAIYWSRVDSQGRATKPKHVATVRAADLSYRYMSSALKPGSLHRFTFQRVGKRGSRQSLKRCPSITLKCQSTARIPSAPVVSVDYEAFRQIYTADPTGDNRVHSIEGRIGGWIVSSPAFILDPDDGRSVSDSLVFTSENAAGEKHVSVYARSKLANGQYGVATQVLPESTLGFRDGRSTAENNAEDGYATAGILPLDLAIASGELHWSSSSTALGPVYYEQNEIDLGSATRAIASCVIQGYQTRPETLADLDFQLGSDLGRRWSIEGPMDVTRPSVVDGIDLTNASVKIEWRWTSGTSLTGVEYQEFVPQEVYFQKCQFRLVFTRPTDGFDTFVQRMSTLITLPPLQEAIELDGGSF